MAQVASEVLPGLVVALLFLLQIRQHHRTLRLRKKLRELTSRLLALERARDLSAAKKRLGLDDG